MSTFYLLPPRALLADRLADCLQAVLPGLDLNVSCRHLLLDGLCEAAAGPDVYLVHREDLPPGECAARALVEGYGAAPGDEVVEVRPGPRPGELTSRRWRVAEGPMGRVAA
jgi:hypothetical protein